MTTEGKRKSAVDVLKRMAGPYTFAVFMLGTRTMKDMNQAEMAQFLGISKSTLCDIEKGRQLVSARLAAKIARKCGVPEAPAVEAALTDVIRKAKLKLKVSVRTTA